MSRAVLVVGAAGVGKSTLINDLTKDTSTNVSHKLSTDGMNEVKLVVGGAATDSVSFIDTPGLDCSDIRRSTSKVVQSLFSDKKILIALVINKSHKRISTYKAKFQNLVSNLLEEDKQFLVVWVGTETLREEDRKDMKEQFPNALQVDIVKKDLKELRAKISDATLYSDINSKPTRKLVSSDPSSREQAPPPKQLVTGFPKWINKPDSLKQTEKVPTDLITVLNKVIACKQASEEQFSVLRVMGGSLLRTLAYQYLCREGVTSSIESRAKSVLGSDDECEMSRLFDTYLRAPYNLRVISRGEVMQIGAKCDFFEALVEYARIHEKHDVMRFFITELFKTLQD